MVQHQFIQSQHQSRQHHRVTSFPFVVNSMGEMGVGHTIKTKSLYFMLLRITKKTVNQKRNCLQFSSLTPKIITAQILSSISTSSDWATIENSKSCASSLTLNYLSNRKHGFSQGLNTGQWGSAANPTPLNIQRTAVRTVTDNWRMRTKQLGKYCFVSNGAKHIS